MAVITCENVTKIYGSGEPRIAALDGVDLSVEPGEFVTVMGASGSGKSTLLHILGSVDRPTAGTVMVGGEDVAALNPTRAAVFRRRTVGIVYQFFNLIPTLTVRENILLPLLLDGREADEAYYGELVSLLGLEDRQKAFPSELSGGQQQRLCIARAIAMEPEVILMDEPTSALDPIATAKIEELIEQLKTTYTIVIVTHSMQQASRVSDDTAFFLLGEIVEADTTRKLFSKPADQRTEDYITGRFG